LIYKTLIEIFSKCEVAYSLINMMMLLVAVMIVDFCICILSLKSDNFFRKNRSGICHLMCIGKTIF